MGCIHQYMDFDWREIMKNILILVAGMPGSGKTSFAGFLADKLKIVFICKDRMKEILWETLQYDTNVRSESKKYGALAYAFSFHFCESIMKTGQSIVFESNFTQPRPEILHEMVKRYGYKVVTVLFGGDNKVIHRRFLKRDSTPDRHPGLVSNNYFSDYTVFTEATKPCRDFNYGDAVLKVDTTNFGAVSYEQITADILQACGEDFLHPDK